MIGAYLFLIYHTFQVVLDQLHVINTALICVRIPSAKSRIDFTDIVLSVNFKNVNFIYGGNGTGKTTLSRLISGEITSPFQATRRIEYRDAPDDLKTESAFHTLTLALRWDEHHTKAE